MDIFHHEEDLFQIAGKIPLYHDKPSAAPFPLIILKLHGDGVRILHSLIQSSKINKLQHFISGVGIREITQHDLDRIGGVFPSALQHPGNVFRVTPDLSIRIRRQVDNVQTPVDSRHRLQLCIQILRTDLTFAHLKEQEK